MAYSKYLIIYVTLMIIQLSCYTLSSQTIDSYLSSLKIDYDKYLFSNTPGGSIINIIRPPVDLEQFQIKNYQSYLIIIKSNLISNLNYLNDNSSLANFVNASPDCRLISQFDAQSHCKLRVYDTLANNISNVRNEKLYLIGNSAGFSILKSLAYNRFIDYETIETSLIKAASFYQVTYVIKYNLSNSSLPTYKSIAPSDLIRTNQETYMYSVIKNLNSDINEESARLIYKNYSTVELSWSIRENSSFCSIKMYRVYAIDETRRNVLNFTTSLAIDSKFFNETCSNFKTLAKESSQDLTCEYLTPISGFSCSITINDIVLNSLYSFKITPISIDNSEEIWQTEATYPPLATDISLPPVKTILKVSSLKASLNEQEKVVALAITCPKFDQQFGSIYQSFIFLVNLKKDVKFNLNNEQNQVYLNNLTQNTVRCNQDNSSLCLLQIYDKLDVDLNNDTTFLIGKTNLNLELSHYKRFINYTQLDKENAYQVFLIFELRNPFAVKRARNTISNHYLLYSTELSDSIRIEPEQLMTSTITMNATVSKSYLSKEKSLERKINVVKIVLIVVLVLVSLISIMFVLLFRRRFVQRFLETRKCCLFESKQHVYEKKRQDMNFLGDGKFEKDFEFDITSISKICKVKHENNDLLFKEEFAKLPEFVHLKTTNASDDPENQTKNRYADIKAFDDTRVILDVKNTNENDYINANYININMNLHYLNNSNDNNKKHLYKYIATQGPKTETIVDFWRMIDQQRVNLIVMLTNLSENNKIKCVQYWPSKLNQPQFYGNYEITFLSEHFHVDFVKRIFKLTNKMNQSSNNEEHLIEQFHYRDWFDKDVPNADLISLFHLIKQVNLIYNDKKSKKSPIVIHCSAGVGRTGTYICLDALSQLIDSNKTLNIFDLISKLREYRQNIIQNYKQYAFIYDALYEYHTHGLTNIERNDFITRYGMLSKNSLSVTFKNPMIPNNKLNKTLVENEYNKLCSPSIFYSLVYLHPGIIKDISNIEKKLKTRDIILNANRQKQSSLKKPSSIISSMMSFRPVCPNQFIITKHSLPDFTLEFLSLIKEFDCNVVVSMNNQSHNLNPNMFTDLKKETTKSFTFDGYKYDIFLLKSQTILTKSSSLVNCYKINLSKNNSKVKEFRIHHFILDNYWQDDKQIPLNPSASSLMNLIIDIYNLHSSKPIIVNENGTGSNSSIFCTLFALYSQLVAHDSVDVFRIVKLIKIQQLNAIENLDQYKFIYDSLFNLFTNKSIDREHADDTDSNFKNEEIEIEIGLDRLNDINLIMDKVN